VNALGLRLSNFEPDAPRANSAEPFVIGILNCKGGVAKTTLCQHLAGILAKSKKSVLVLDFVGPLHDRLSARSSDLPTISSFKANKTYFNQPWPARTQFDHILIDCNTSDYVYCASVIQGNPRGVEAARVSIPIHDPHIL
jgi:chromosome partitioning protein